MDLTALRAFLSLCETQNMRDTAVDLGLGQSNVSRALARLEREVGARLFQRHGRRLRLNHHGGLFRTHATRAVADLDAGVSRITADTEHETGLVRLGFLQSTARDVIPDLLRSYRRQAPGSRFELRQGLARDLYPVLRNDQLDVLIATPPDDSQADVDFTPVYEQQLTVAVPADHRLAARAQVSLHEIRAEPFIAFNHQTDVRRVTDRLFDQVGFQPHPVFESAEIETVTGLIAAGLGVGILPGSQQLDADAIVHLPLDPPQFRIIGLATPKHATFPASVARFLDHVRSRRLEDGSPRT